MLVRISGELPRGVMVSGSAYLLSLHARNRPEVSRDPRVGAHTQHCCAARREQSVDHTTPHSGARSPCWQERGKRADDRQTGEASADSRSGASVRIECLSPIDLQQTDKHGGRPCDLVGALGRSDRDLAGRYHSRPLRQRRGSLSTAGQLGRVRGVGECLS